MQRRNYNNNRNNFTFNYKDYKTYLENSVKATMNDEF